ncbi:MAG: CehA/McbA family metallohydrolase [Propionibacteriaceae bacterium]
MASTVLRLHLTPADRAADPYPLVPFEVRAADSVEVLLDYDATDAVIDLGCTDPVRWRGWSGGARSRFVIGTEQATPGYESGALPDGDWAVVLGLHRIPAAGVDVQVTVNVPASGPPEADPPAPPVPDTPFASGRNLPAPDGLRWYAGDFHAHTLHSDGSLSIDQLTAHARERGLDFLAVTDHNTVSHVPHLPAAAQRYGVCLIPGQELTTPRGHANAFGDIGWIDFRRPAAEWVGEVERRGGILSVNHPLEGDCAWLHPLPVKPLALELWHISWFRDLKHTFAWALWPLWDQRAVLLGGSDFHAPEEGWPLGTPTTWVAAEECTPAAILAGVRAGRTAISAQPAGPVMVRSGDTLVAVDAVGTELVDVDGGTMPVGEDPAVFTVAENDPYHLRGGDGSLLAISR